MVCAQCADPLVKRQVIKPTQILALIAAAAFIAPLITMIFVLIERETKPTRQQPLLPIVELPRKKSKS